MERSEFCFLDNIAITLLFVEWCCCCSSSAVVTGNFSLYVCMMGGGKDECNFWGCVCMLSAVVKSLVRGSPLL